MERVLQGNEVRGPFSHRGGSGDWRDSPVSTKPNHFGTSIPKSNLHSESSDPDSCPFCQHYEFWSKNYKRSDHVRECAKIFLTGDKDNTISDDYYKACAGTYPDSSSLIGERFISAIENDDTGHYAERFANDYDNGVKH